MTTATATATARIEVFRPGTFTPMEGGALSYTAADLRAIVDAYDYDTAPAPVVVGHPSTDAPAYAWAKSFDFDASAGRLYATVGEIDPAFGEAVKKGRYKKVSLSFFRPEDAANPVPGTWYPRHIGFLGGAAPAVAGLKNVQFSSAPAATFSAAFGEQGFEDAASLFRSVREFFIEKFGMEDADKALPAYRLEWLAEATVVPKPAQVPAFSQPVPPQKELPTVVTQPNPDFAAREAEVARREAALKNREKELDNSANVSFAETLIADGKLLPESKADLVAILGALPVETSVSFASGQATVTVPVAQALRDLLAKQPKVVSFGALDLGDDPGGDKRPASFAADGKAVDPAGLDLHAKALAYQKKNPGTAFLDAVRAVQ